MPPYTKSQIASANDTDIAKYLQSRGIELKRVSNLYVWKERNVWIRGSEWYSHYEQTGGHAVGFVMKYFGLPFTDAVRELTREIPIFSSPPDSPHASPGPLLPKSFKNAYRVFMYLRNARCISPDVINTFIKLGLKNATAAPSSDVTKTGMPGTYTGVRSVRILCAGITITSTFFCTR